MHRIPFDRVNWITSSFLIGTALIALVGVPIYLWQVGIDWFQFALFFFYIVATMMSITVGYHRLFSHLSFKAKTPVKLFTLIFGACAFENSCLNWVSDHRRHHKHVDHDEDPYDISKGFFWAHIGWLLSNSTQNRRWITSRTCARTSSSCGRTNTLTGSA